MFYNSFDEENIPIFTLLRIGPNQVATVVSLIMSLLAWKHFHSYNN